MTFNHHKLSSKNLIIKSTFLLIFLSFIFLFSSCKTKKKVVTEDTNISLKGENLFKYVENSILDYQWYSFKSNATVYFSNNSIGGSTDIRIKKDELIWMSVKKFGFEVARILVKPDSFFVVDRFNSQYMAEPINILQKNYDIHLNFNEMQDLLVGNSIVDNQLPVDGRKVNDNYILKTNGNDLGITYKMDSEYKVLNSKFFNNDNKTIEIDFSDYKSENGKNIPYLRKYSYPDNENPEYSLKLNIKKLSIDKSQKVKFEIPNSYKKI